MSSLIVEVCKINDIQPHDNADKLEIATIKGWQCIVMKDKYKKGDKVVYVPIDSMIPFELSEKLGITKYLQNKKKDNLGNIISSRVKTIKLRGILSQGLVLDIDDPSWKVGDDVREKLGIEKYIPVFDQGNINLINKFPGWRLPEFIEFNKYTDIENYKNYLDIFEEDEEVIVTEKTNGTNARIARLLIDQSYFSVLQRVIIKLKKIANTMTFGWYEYDPTTFLVGSHNCNIKKLYNREQINDKIPFSNNSMSIYWNIALEYELDKKLREGEEIFGEIYGTGIQKYFEYDGTEKVKIRFFDMKVRSNDGNMNYLDWDTFVEKCNYLDLPIVPILYRGPFRTEILPNIIKGKSTFGNHIREGCVIKPVKERFHPKLGRVILKCINDDYLFFKGKKEDELAKRGKEAELDIFSH